MCYNMKLTKKENADLNKIEVHVLSIGFCKLDLEQWRSLNVALRSGNSANKKVPLRSVMRLRVIAPWKGQIRTRISDAYNGILPSL
jgi:hypothetical protein